MMGKCRIKDCGKKAQWYVGGKNEPLRSYCSLTHLAQEVNEALSQPYSTPDIESKNASFYKGKDGKEIGK